MFKKFIILSLITLYCYSAFSQQGKGVISGVVKDLKTGQPISNVTIRISQTKQSTFTNEKGEFKFDGLTPGSYTLRFFHKNYSPTKIPHQEVFANSAVFLPVTLVTASGEGEGTDESFMIGSIEVTAKRSVLPEKTITSTEITSGEIAHLQATSLGDVMQMVPGVAQTNPGLGRQSQLILRGIGGIPSGNSYLGDVTSLNTAFGTKIIVDGSTFSNNANINTITLGSYAQTNENGGVDLRGIPADNIESVEILQGVSSAKYGDFTEGVVLVKTKGGYQPQRLSIKTNPDTKELNYNGGLNVMENMTFNYNFNLGTSERNIRREGDEYERLAGQIKIGNTFFEDKSLEMTNGFYYTRLFDDYKEPEDPINGKQYYNRGYTFLYNNDMKYKINNLERLEFHLSLNYQKQDKFKQDITKGSESDNRYITGFMQPGTYAVGKSFGAYVYQVTEKGNIWNFSVNGDWSKRGIRTGSLIHNLSAGFDYQYDDNTGEGLNFDPKKPQNGDKRPFSYDATPANSNLSVFAEDEMNGVFWKPFTLSFGLRYEMFSPESIDFKGLLFNTDFVKSRSGSFLQPRIAFRYFLSQDTRLRLAYGKSAKSPSLSFIYPEPQYFDLREYYGDYRDTISDPTYPVLFTCYIFNQTNLHLRGYEESKYELSLDQKITDDIGLTLRGYYSLRNNELKSYSNYFFIPVYTHPNWPNTGNEQILRYTSTSFSEYHNTGYSRFRGINIILTTKKIESINSSFYIAGAYDFTEAGERGGFFRQKSPVLWNTLDSLQKKYHSGTNIIPVYSTTDRISNWYEKIMMTYKWDFTVRKLGLWFTLWAQQILYVKSKLFQYYNEEASGYISEDGIYRPYPENTPSAGKIKTIEQILFYTHIIDTWTFNINISKSLYKGAEVSFFVNSFLDRMNNIFYGLQFSADINKFFE